MARESVSPLNYDNGRSRSAPPIAIQTHTWESRYREAKVNIWPMKSSSSVKVTRGGKKDADITTTKGMAKKSSLGEHLAKLSRNDTTANSARLRFESRGSPSKALSEYANPNGKCALLRLCEIDKRRTGLTKVAADICAYCGKNFTVSLRPNDVCVTIFVNRSPSYTCGRIIGNCARVFFYDDDSLHT